MGSKSVTHAKGKDFVNPSQNGRRNPRRSIADLDRKEKEILGSQLQSRCRKQSAQN
jgi:hypothetical protein